MPKPPTDAPPASYKPMVLPQATLALMITAEDALMDLIELMEDLMDGGTTHSEGQPAPAEFLLTEVGGHHELWLEEMDAIRDYAGAALDKLQRLPSTPAVPSTEQPDTATRPPYLELVP